MPEQFDRIEEFVRRVGVLAEPGALRAEGTRRVRRRKTRRIALSAGAVAVVAGIGTTLAASVAGTASTGSPGTGIGGATASASLRTAWPSASATTVAVGSCVGDGQPNAAAGPGSSGSSTDPGLPSTGPSLGPTYVPYAVNPHDPVSFARDSGCMKVTFTDPYGISLIGEIGPDEQSTVRRLHELGFTHVTARAVASTTVPAGDTVDVVENPGGSVAGRSLIPADTSVPLVVLYSSGR